MSLPGRSLSVLLACLVVTATGACVSEVEPPRDGAASAGTPGTPPPSASARSTSTAPVAADEVVPGCSDAQATELGDVVGGVDVDGDGEKDVVRYIAGEDGASPGEGCARTITAYVPDGVAGFVLPAGAEAPAAVESLQPGGEGATAYATFRSAVPAGGYQQHLLALTGTAPDLRLVEVGVDGSDEPLLPTVDPETTGLRGGFLCADGALVTQVGAPRTEGGGDAAIVWDVTTTTYEVAVDGDRAVATPVDETTQTGVADDALEFGYPALLPESTANLCA